MTHYKGNKLMSDVRVLDQQQQLQGTTAALQARREAREGGEQVFAEQAEKKAKAKYRQKE
jgi:hypothetical protein